MFKERNEKRIALLFLAFCLIFLTTGCQEEMQVQPLVIKGDVIQEVKLHEVWHLQERQELDWNDQKIEGIPLESLVKEAQIYSENDWLLVAEDGFMVRLKGETIQDTYFSYSDPSQWFFVSDKHPVNSRIKRIKEVILVKNDSLEANYETGFTLIQGKENLHFSYGELLAQDFQILQLVEGVSRLENVAIDVMKLKRVIPISQLASEDFGQILMMNQAGEALYRSINDGYLVLENGQVHYLSLDQAESVRDLYGIMLDPPAHSVMDAYHDAVYYVDRDIPVLILFLDGFSYWEYLALADQLDDSYLGQLPQAKKATTIYKPVTNAGFAAMITGQAPAVNGIYDRSFREVEAPTIFDYVMEKGGQTLLLEGGVKILNTNGTIRLHMDENQNGTSDDEIFATAKAELKGSGLQYAMVHFHSIDDAGHLSGPEGALTWERIEMIDGYVEALTEMWPGMVIITADHGMHAVGSEGSHGDFRSEDLMIPYWIVQGGAYEN